MSQDQNLQPFILQPEIAPASGLLDSVREHRLNERFANVDKSVQYVTQYLATEAPRLLYVEDVYSEASAEVPSSARFEADSSLNVAATRHALGIFGQTTGDQEGFTQHIGSLAEGETYEKPVTDNLSVVFSRRQRQMLATRFITNDDHKEAAAKDFWELRDRLLAHDPLVKVMAEIRTGFEANQTEVYSSETFNLLSQSDAIQTFLSASRLDLRLGSGNEPFSTSKIKNGLRIADTLFENLPMHYPGEAEDVYKEGIYVDENGRFQKLLIGTNTPGLYFGLRSTEPDSSNSLEALPLQLGLEIDVQEVYGVERSYNGEYSVEVVPFIDTVAAVELLTKFNEAGLQLSDRIKDTFAEVGSIEKRYGHGYADLTREVAKLVNDPKRSLRTFFSAENEDEIRERVRQLPKAYNPAAEAVLTILRQREGYEISDQSAAIELPVSSNRAELRDGSCKDIEVYAAYGHLTPDGSMLKTDYKVPTFIVRQPVRLNGVVLPVGSLLLKQEDGYLFMRITSFAFDDDMAKETFGAQYLENARATHQRLDRKTLLEAEV